MSFKTPLWHKKFVLEDFPSLPCPRCDSGRLVLLKGTVQHRDAHRPFTDAERNELPDDYVNRKAAMLLKCSRSDCWEVVSAIGDFSVEETEIEGHQAFVDAFQVRGMYPAPPMIEIPKGVPKMIRKQLEASFSIY